MTDFQKGIIGYIPTEGRKISQSLPLADFERDMVIYFFAKLKLADPRFYNQAMPDEKTEKLTKREFSNLIRYLTNEQIDNGFVLLHKAMAAGDDEYRFLTIPKVIGLCDGSSAEGVQAGAHKTFEHVALQLPEPKEYRSKRYEEGIKQTAALLAMLEPEPPKPPTPTDIKDLERVNRIKAE